MFNVSINHIELVVIVLGIILEILKLINHMVKS
nr:MAG TPA: hypothetical protein [Caudoviricetes sp.]DAR61020.1 MAG TPA: hypothetical protein [Caudoviricetes sp.]